MAGKRRNSIEQSNPTGEAYGCLTRAFDYFNKALFAGQLPRALITYHRHNKARAYFCGGRFLKAHVRDSSGKFTDEIAINPQHVADRTPTEIMSTLVHEMAHSWQYNFGKKPTRCYHDKEWAAKMKEIGLQPSATGKPGGKETGSQMTHYILPGGSFDQACKKFLDANTAVFYADVQTALGALAKRKGKAGKDDDGDEGDGPEKSKGRAKFVCKGCGLIALARPGANLRCDDCDRPMHKEEKDG